MLVPQTRVESVGNVWVAFSPASGETMFLNDESAAVVEILSQGPARPETVEATLAGDSGAAQAEVAAVLRESWPRLVEAGLVRLLRSNP